MTRSWIGLLPCASVVIALAISCGSSDGGESGGGSGFGGNAEAGGDAGTSGRSEAGGSSEAGAGGTAGADRGAGASGAPDSHDRAGAGGSAGGDGGSTDADGGAGGSPGASEDGPLSPAAISGLAFWMDGNAPSYSDADENYLTPPDSGRIRSIPEAPPLTGSWQAPGSAERPVRELGALSLKPIDTYTGFYLHNMAATLHTDGSTLAISFRPLLGAGGPAQGGISAPIDGSFESLGLYFIGNQVGLYFNHTGRYLSRRLSRGAHTTIIVRFTATAIDVQYDIDGLRASENIALGGLDCPATDPSCATIAHETASNFYLGYDPGHISDIYGYVSQAVGIDRAVSDAEGKKLMNWLTAQPIPEAFPVTKPLVAILGDSIANGDQVPTYQSWAFRMLSDLSDTNLSETNPDIQLLNAATNGSGIPKVKDSDYSNVVLPRYSASRAKNILVVATGTNDLANGNNLSDLLDRYYGLLDAAHAAGWKVVACTVLPRSDASFVGAGGFEMVRTAFNTDIVKNWAAHADALADVTAIARLGAAGDSDNSEYYSPDKIHPNAVGHALLEKVYRTAVKGLL